MTTAQLGLFGGQDVRGLDVAVDDAKHVSDQDVMLEQLAALGCSWTWRRHSTKGTARPAELPPRDQAAVEAAWAWVMKQRSW